MLRIIQETYPLILVPFSLLISEKNIEKWEAINNNESVSLMSTFLNMLTFLAHGEEYNIMC
jgi:hypothetical protein